MKKVDQGFIERVLLSLVLDVASLEEAAERVRIQIAALAKEHGISIPVA